VTIDGDNRRKAGSMAETSSGYVVSDLPDLTGVALADLPAISLRHESVVLERVTDHPQNQEQRGFSPA
jgi:hypothetical protein